MPLASSIVTPNIAAPGSLRNWYFWVFCSGSHKAAIRASVGCTSFWLSDPLPSSQGHWQNLVLCSCRTEGPAFLLSPACCSAVPSLHVAPFWTLSQHGSFLLQGQQEAFFLQAVPSKEFRPVSIKLLSFPSTVGAKSLTFATSKSSGF